MGVSNIFKVIVGSSLPVAGVSFFGGGVLDGSFSRELNISVNDSSSNQEYVHFFKDLRSNSQKQSGLFIKTKLTTKNGLGEELKGGLGIKLSSGQHNQQDKEENRPWVLIGSAENGMFYIPGWRVTDPNGPVTKVNKAKKRYPTWRSWFNDTTFDKNEDKVGPDVWCDSFFEAYRGFLTGPLKVVIQEGKPIFLGNKQGGQNKIYVNQNNGTSITNFKKAHCNHSQGFAWLGPEAVIVGNFSNSDKRERDHIGRTFKFQGLGTWTKAQGVSLGNMKGFVLDRIDRFSVSEKGIKDSRGNMIEWNSVYNPTIKINYSHK